ncbi:MAG: anti-sigma factor antagonist [Micromonosporaceae bacterium]|nr:anti-sigma factor antagonist [Micromonosporaceae bacterium]
MTAAHLKVEEMRTATDAVLILTGEIDMATAGDLRAATTRTLREPPARVVLDFAGVTFCDSQGLSTLISINREVTGVGGRLVLINVGDFMSRLLEITGLRAAFEFEDTSK